MAHKHPIIAGGKEVGLKSPFVDAVKKKVGK